MKQKKPTTRLKDQATNSTKVRIIFQIYRGDKNRSVPPPPFRLWLCASKVCRFANNGPHRDRRTVYLNKRWRGDLRCTRTCFISKKTGITIRIYRHDDARPMFSNGAAIVVFNSFRNRRTSSRNDRAKLSAEVVLGRLRFSFRPTAGPRC